MATDEIKQVLDQRQQLLSNLCGQKDYDAIVSLFTEDATFMPVNCTVKKGRQAIKECAKNDCIISKKTLTEGFDYFELINNNTAFTNGYVVEIDENGTHLNGFKADILWKKLDGEWYIDRYMYNFRSKTDKTQHEEYARKEIESKVHFVFDQLNERDFDAAMSVFAEDAIFVPPMEEQLIGRDAIRKHHEEVLMPQLNKLVVDQLYHYETLSDESVYINVFVNAVDNAGKVTMRFRDTQLWKKKDGVWYSQHVTISERED